MIRRLFGRGRKSAAAQAGHDPNPSETATS